MDQFHIILCVKGKKVSHACTLPTTFGLRVDPNSSCRMLPVLKIYWFKARNCTMSILFQNHRLWLDTHIKSKFDQTWPRPRHWTPLEYKYSFQTYDMKGAIYKKTCLKHLGKGSFNINSCEFSCLAAKQ